MGEKTERGNYLPSLVAGLGIHQLTHKLIPKPNCWASVIHWQPQYLGLGFDR